MSRITILIALLNVFSINLHAVQGNDDQTFKSLIQDHKIKLTDAASLDTLISLSSAKKVVLLGEATHGTSEFYAWRDSISRRLIKENSFNFILVEGDWASLYLLNEYVKGKSNFESATEVVRQFDRWPLWMWRNEEVVALAEWLKQFNETRPDEKKVGFYGMDVYDEWRSYDEVIGYLADYDPELLDEISGLYYCMKMFGRDSWNYASAVSRGYNSCAPLLKQAYEQIKEVMANDGDIPAYEKLFVVQNARVFKNAEKFFRKAVLDRASSWNSRVEHMYITLEALLRHYGDDSRAIVWAHNTHIGDARYTDMIQQGQYNIGQLSRERLGQDNVLLVGFGTYTGIVTAGRQWGQAMQQLRLPKAASGSFELKLHQAQKGNFLLVMNPELRLHPFFGDYIGHRAVGVVYNPENEHLGNYVPTIPGLRYDAFIFIERTKPLNYVR